VGRGSALPPGRAGTRGNPDQHRPDARPDRGGAGVEPRRLVRSGRFQHQRSSAAGDLVLSAVVTPLPAAAPRRLGLKVVVRALKVEALIGDDDHEHGRLQPLSVDVELDLGAAPVERLADTLDYDGVARIVRELAAGPHIALIETFAERTAVACLA